jgi:hypothetical protein
MSTYRKIEWPPGLGYAAFCLALGMASGFLAGRDWSAKAQPASTASISELQDRMDDLLPVVEVTFSVIQRLLDELPPSAVEDNVSTMVGLPAMAIAAQPNAKPRVEIGDSVLISADQSGRVYAICEPQR